MPPIISELPPPLHTSAAILSSIDAVQLHYDTCSGKEAHFGRCSLSSSCVNFNSRWQWAEAKCGCGDELTQDVDAFADYMISQQPASQQQLLQQIKQHQMENEVCQRLWSIAGMDGLRNHSERCTEELSSCCTRVVYPQWPIAVWEQDCHPSITSAEYTKEATHWTSRHCKVLKKRKPVSLVARYC